jgi:hypothetical protein
MHHLRTLSLALCASGATLVCAAQTPVIFSGITTLAGNTPATLYAVDLNNDGITDILQDTGLSAPGFTVSLGNGDGTFKPSVHYSVPSGSLIGINPMATGDFNNDGIVDIAVVLDRDAGIADYLGNGDGTFQAPKISTIALPSGLTFTEGGAQAADFNADGKLDLVAWATSFPNGISTASALYVLQGDGAGGFSNPRDVLDGPGFQPVFQTFVGDYDSDGKPDIAATTYVNDSTGKANTTVHVLFGNNDFTFSDTTPYTVLSPFILGSGDLNSDGYTDLYGINGYAGVQQLGVFYGNSARTFNSFFLTLSGTYPVGSSSDAANYMSQFTLGDFNGDGRMDLAVMGWNQAFSQAYVEFLLATGSPGQFTMQPVPLATTYNEDSAPIAGFFSGSFLKPDIGLNQSPNYGSPPQDFPSYLVAEVNQASSGWFGPCTYPRSGEGFNVCSPGTANGSTAAFNAAVNSFGQLRKIELWVDGNKVSEQHHTWDQHGYLSYNSTFAPGSHTAAFFAADVDSRLQSFYLTFVIAGTACKAPSSPGVNICIPANNSTVSSPQTVQATANITGKLARMELWIDGVKFYTETTSSTLITSYPLAAGKHQFGVYAVNTAGTKWLNTVNATVPSPALIVRATPGGSSSCSSP